MAKQTVEQIVEYYSAIRRDKLLIHSATWMNIQGIILSEKDQFQKSIYYMIPFDSQTGKVIEMVN